MTKNVWVFFDEDGDEIGCTYDEDLAYFNESDIYDKNKCKVIKNPEGFLPGQNHLRIVNNEIVVEKLTEDIKKKMNEKHIKKFKLDKKSDIDVLKEENTELKNKNKELEDKINLILDKLNMTN